MRIAVFGASGRTGRILVSKALDAGDQVVALVRAPDRLALQRDGLRMITGTVQDLDRVRAAIAGTDAVVSTVGPVRGEPAAVMTATATHLVVAMRETGVRRLVYMTGAGVLQPQDPPALASRIMLPLMRLLARAVLEDAERAVGIVSGSELDWVIVRAPRLADTSGRGRFRHGYIKPSLQALAREDVAEFTLRQVRDDTYLRRMPIISY